MTGPTTDLFFGIRIPHVAVLLVLYATLAAWFLLALARNIKRDPSVYEIYRPVQAFALALYLNFLVLGFYRWMVGFYNASPPRFVTGTWQFHPVAAQTADSTLLVFSLGIFLFLGITLLRNRERARRFLREFGSSSADWLAAIWPAPYLVAGIALCGVAQMAMIQFKLPNDPGWNPGLGALHVAFGAAWLARDFLYLQWMNLRRARRPLLAAVLYWVVYYACVTVVLSTLHMFDSASSSIAAIFIPSAGMGVDAATWAARQPQWITSLVLLLAQALVFAWLQRRELKQLAAAGSVAASEPQPVAS